jgi:hypothetical protein
MRITPHISGGQPQSVAVLVDGQFDVVGETALSLFACAAYVYFGK